MHHHFISYSNADGLDFTTRLHNALEGGYPKHPAWMDRHDLIAGRDWDLQIRDAIRDCNTLIFVMTLDSVSDTSVCRNEWTLALKYKKIVVPLLVDKQAESPFRLENRQYIDFSSDFDGGMAKLRDHLDWLKSPAGELQRMKDQRADAERDLRRARDEVVRKRIEVEIAQLDKDIERQQAIVDDPAAAAARTAASVQAGIERERQPSDKPITQTRFINPPPTIAPTYFQNRHIETQQVVDFLRDNTVRMLTIVGRGGVGKSAMTCRLLKSLERGKLPDDIGEMAVDGIVYLSALGSRRMNMANCYADLCKLLPDDTAAELEGLYRNPQTSTEDKMRTLLGHFPPDQTVILLLDNFEDVVDTETFAVTDAELDEALRALLNQPEHGVKVIITTRIKPHDLLTYRFNYQRLLELEKGLESPYAENILREMDHDGTLGLRDLPPEHALLKEARDRTRGYPRALEALVAILAVDRSTSLAEMLAAIRARENQAGEAQLLPTNVVEEIVGEAFNRLDPSARLVMQALAIYARPVTPNAVDYLLQPYAPSIDSTAILGRLVNMHFARKESGRFFLHPVDRAYACGLVERGKVDTEKQEFRRLFAVIGIDPPTSEDKQRPFNQIALAERGAEYFKSTRKPRDEWKTIEDLTPQLAEFDLRCAADDYDTAAYVLLGIDFDYLQLWGHFRIVSELHERLQEKISDPTLRGYSAGNLGTAQWSLGNIYKAIHCFEVALCIARELENRWAEGAWLGSLGNIYKDLGNYQIATDHYQQALIISREVGDRKGEGVRLSNLGITYKNLGDYQRAIEYYQKALFIRREIGDKRGESADLNNLGIVYKNLGNYQYAVDHCQRAVVIAHEIGNQRGQGNALSSLGTIYRDLGNYQHAIDHLQQSLVIRRKIGDRIGESSSLENLADIHVAQGNCPKALETCVEAIQIADKIGLVQIQHGARETLIRAHLYCSDLPAARAVIAVTQEYDVPCKNHTIAALLGLTALRQSERSTAQAAFTDAIIKSDALLAYTEQNYDAHFTKGLSLCGLSLCESTAHVLTAIESYRAARAVTAAAGIIHDQLQRFDALAVADTEGVLTEVRVVLAGE